MDPAEFEAGSTIGAERVVLPSELHCYVRSGGNVRSRQRRLLPGHTAAYGFQFKTSILRGFDGAADRFPDERRHFDSALLNI